MTLFDRRVSAIVGDRRFEGGSAYTDLRIAFKVTQSLDAKENTADCTISNLNEQSRGAISLQKKPQFIIEAGYVGLTGLVFKGTAEKIIHKRTSPGFLTEVNASDGAKEGKRVVNVAVAPGSTVQDIVNLIAQTMRISVVNEASESISIATYINGYTASGTAKTELDKIMKSIGVRWAVVDGRLILLGKNKTTKEEAVLLSEDTGLIGTPERTYDAKRPKQLLFSAKSLLQSKLKPGRRVVVKSKELNGTFRVEVSTHTGDTHGSEFYSEVRLAEVKPV